jgi:hypothetical protein
MWRRKEGVMAAAASKKKASAGAKAQLASAALQLAERKLLSWQKQRMAKYHQ